MIPSVGVSHPPPQTSLLVHGITAAMARLEVMFGLSNINFLPPRLIIYC